MTSIEIYEHDPDLALELMRLREMEDTPTPPLHRMMRGVCLDCGATFSIARIGELCPARTTSTKEPHVLRS